MLASLTGEMNHTFVKDMLYIFFSCFISFVENFNMHFMLLTLSLPVFIFLLLFVVMMIQVHMEVVDIQSICYLKLNIRIFVRVHRYLSKPFFDLKEK